MHRPTPNGTVLLAVMVALTILLVLIAAAIGFTGKNREASAGKMQGDQVAACVEERRLVAAGAQVVRQDVVGTAHGPVSRFISYCLNPLSITANRGGGQARCTNMLHVAISCSTVGHVSGVTIRSPP